VLDVLDAIKEKDIVVEVNTRGLYKKRAEDYFPARWILEELRKREIPVMPASDAHDPADIFNGMEACLSDLRALGFSSCRIPGKTGMRDISL
jgi:histidinol-phosphatase (PHP family)